MKKLSPQPITAIAMTNLGPTEHWRQAFGEPAPIMAKPRLMAAIIDEYGARQARIRSAEEKNDGSRR